MSNDLRVPDGWRHESPADDRTTLELRYNDDDDFLLSAKLVKGVVTYGIATRLPGKSAGISGEAMFDLMIGWIGKDNIRVLRGRWSYSDKPGHSSNLETFNRLTRPATPLTEEQAAFMTFTGKMVTRKLGFAKAVVTRRKGNPGAYLEIEVDFSATDAAGGTNEPA